jgi:hypothetical protein
MESELETLIAIKKLPGDVPRKADPMDAVLSELHGDGTFSGVDEHGNQYPCTIPPQDLNRKGNSAPR